MTGENSHCDFLPYFASGQEMIPFFLQTTGSMWYHESLLILPVGLAFETPTVAQQQVYSEKEKNYDRSGKKS